MKSLREYLRKRRELHQRTGEAYIAAYLEQHPQAKAICAKAEPPPPTGRLMIAGL